MKKIGRYVIIIFSITIAILTAGELVVRGYVFFYKDRLSSLMQDILLSDYNLISYKIKSVNMYFLKSNVSANIYLHSYGLSWQHVTDPYGFRNGPVEKRDVLLLGDSFVYGHGVETDQTVAETLRHHFGIPAYNMGISSSCLYQNYILLRTYYDLFKPKKIIIFTFFNDIDDLLALRSEKQLSERPEITSYNYDVIFKETQKGGKGILESIRMIRYKIYLYRLFKSKDIILMTFRNDHKNQVEAGHQGLSISVYSRPGYTLIENYYLSILRDIKRLCSQNNTSVYLINIYPRIEAKNLHMEKAADDFYLFVQNVASRNSIHSYNTKILFNNNPDYFTDDLHLNGNGDKKLAAFVAQAIGIMEVK